MLFRSVLYCGENDLANGAEPEAVLLELQRFYHMLRACFPGTPLAYISVKPSPSREQLMPQIRETNHVISAYLNLLPNSEFIDIYTPMLGADGRPRMELFRGDRLHMTDEGYRLWHSVIASHLPGANPPPAPAGLP